MAMQKCQPKVWRTYRSQRRKIVPLSTCCLGLQPGGCHLATLIRNIVWRYEWHLQKNWGPYLHPSFLDGPTSRRHAAWGKNSTCQSSSDRPRLGGSFLWEMFNGGGLNSRWGYRCCIPTHRSWYEVGKSAYLTTDPMTIQEGRRAIAQAILDNQVKVKGPGHPCVNLLAQQPFWFNALRTSSLKGMSGDCGSDYQESPLQPSRGWEHSRRWGDQRP